VWLDAEFHVYPEKNVDVSLLQSAILVRTVPQKKSKKRPMNDKILKYYLVIIYRYITSLLKADAEGYYTRR